MRNMLKSKIHRARVTEVNLDYEGSVTIDRTLMDASDLLPNEKVDVLDLNNGSRFSTYVIEGEADSGVIGINGAAVRLAAKGDQVIILAYALADEVEARALEPSIVHVDSGNRVK